MKMWFLYCSDCQKENWKDQERDWLPLWVSRPNQGRKNTKKAKHAIGNISKKDLSKIIKEFEKIGKLTYEKSYPNMSQIPD